MIVVTVLVLIVSAIYGYVVAIEKAKAGVITVYKDWWDFGFAISWPICLLVGLIFLEGAMIESDKQPVMRFLAIVFLCLFFMSVGKLVIGAFTLNKKGAWLALHARVFGSIFAIGIIGLIWHGRDSESDRRQNLLVQILWLLFYCWLFKTCVLPLVGDNGNAKADSAPDNSDATADPNDTMESEAIDSGRRKRSTEKGIRKAVASADIKSKRKRKRTRSCANCGQKLNDGDLFCSKCGNRVASAPDTPVTLDSPEKPDTPVSPVTPVAEPVTPVAEAASTEAPLENPETGADMTPPPPEKSPDGKSRLAYLALALSFGWFGLHNFYARRIAPACFQLLLTATAVALFLILKVCPIQDISEARAIQDISFLCFLPVVIWLFTEILTVHKDGKGNQWGEDFASAPGIESIDAMVLAKFRTNSRRCIAAFFLLLILGVCATVANSAVGPVVVGVAFLCPPLMSWYYYARSKGYAAGYSIVLALLGFLGMVMFVVGACFFVKKACFFVKNPLSLVMGGSAFLAGILLPIAAFKVARRILLKNGFKALSSAKKALTVVAIVGSFVLAIAGAGFAVEAMKADDAARQFNRGVALMETGKFEDAVKAFRFAAGIGMLEAQYNLGYCYSNGKGVEKDMVEAVKWFRKAAEKGLPNAQFCLGCCYFSGEGVEKDMDESVRWIRKAAEQGLAEAQGALGEWYLGGGEKDIVEAVKWFRKAAKQGHPKAREALKNLGELDE